MYKMECNKKMIEWKNENGKEEEKNVWRGSVHAAQRPAPHVVVDPVGWLEGSASGVSRASNVSGER